MGAPTTNETMLRDETEIRNLRAWSNAAIAQSDAGQVAAVLSQNATILIASGERLMGVAAITAYFERAFAAPSFVMAARNPETIHVNGSTAAEEGSWQAHWKPNVLRGRYLARWERGASGWKTTAELYIPLDSTLAD